MNFRVLICLHGSSYCVCVFEHACLYMCGSMCVLCDVYAYYVSASMCSVSVSVTSCG